MGLLWKEGCGWVTKGGSLDSAFSPNSGPCPTPLLLTFTVTFSRGSGGTSDWQGPPPSACQHSVASAVSEHGASSCQPSGCSSCSRVARQRLRCARGSVGRGRGHCLPRTLPPAPLPPWSLCVCSPFLKGQMLVLTESSSRGHTWKGNRAPQVSSTHPTRSMCQALN